MAQAGRPAGRSTRLLDRTRPAMSEFAKAEAELSARGYTRMVFDISRIEALLDLLGSPQRSYPSIHLTGTNGKTSTARMVDGLLQSTNLRTGRYTSPHLQSLTERVALDGAPIDEARLAEVFDEVEPYVRLVDERSLSTEGDRMTFFEVLTALAFAAFADAPVDVAVL